MWSNSTYLAFYSLKQHFIWFKTTNKSHPWKYRNHLNTNNPVSSPHSAPISGGTPCSEVPIPASSSSGFLIFNKYTFQHVVKCFLNVIPSKCTRLLKETPHFLRQIFALGSGYSLNGPQIRFVPHNHNNHILTCMFPDPLDPFFNIFEGILLCYVIDHQSPLCLPVVPTSKTKYAEVMARYCSCPAK